jgi:hypothetical protein
MPAASPESESETLAVDGCLLRSDQGKPVSLAVSRGMHEFRASTGSLSAARSIEVHEGQKVSLEVGTPSPGGTPDALGAFVRRLTQGPGPGRGIDGFDPIETGMLDPESRDVLDAQRALIDASADQAPSDLPLSLGLALDGLRAAQRRFDAAGTVCAASLSTAAARELGTGRDDSERALQLAVELLTVTRIRGPQIRGPLRTEKEALERLQISPTRRVLSAVEQLSVRPEIASCLADLTPQATQVNELSALVIGQLPGVRLPDQPSADDDSTQ